MKISKIYEKFKVPSHLQDHMFQVASVAKLICDNFKTEINEQDILHACLLHDIGNIVKFNFTVKPELFEPEGINYW
jgi:HD superfamily phosphodiesterase